MNLSSIANFPGGEHGREISEDAGGMPAGEKLIKTSLVIVNKDERTLSDTLDAVKPFVGQTLEEVLVVDASNGALDDIRVSHEWARWIDYQQPRGVRITIAHQRNIGVSRATGDIIVFTDSGCLPAPGWLENLLAPILEEGEFVSCGPAVALGPSVFSAKSMATDPDSDYVPMAATINLAFRREAFDAAGGFDESFSSGEDLDFTCRLDELGYRLRWVSGAVVQHDYGSRTRQVRRAFFYGRGWCRFFRKHPYRIAWVSPTSPPVPYALFLLGLPLTFKWRWYPLILLWPIWRQRKEELPSLVLVTHFALGAGVLYELARPGTKFASASQTGFFSGALQGIQVRYQNSRTL